MPTQAVRKHYFFSGARVTKWRRVQRLANRAKIRRWLRICKRLVYLYKHIHIYRQ